MRKLGSITAATAIVLTALLLAAAPAAAGGFVPGVEDLPLMPGLKPEPAADVSFNSAEGRIVEAYAAGKVDRAAVTAFYARTLPQLGWQREADTVYRRGAERLRLNFSGGGDKPLDVHFTITPAQGSSKP